MKKCFLVMLSLSSSLHAANNASKVVERFRVVPLAEGLTAFEREDGSISQDEATALSKSCVCSCVQTSCGFAVMVAAESGVITSPCSCCNQSVFKGVVNGCGLFNAVKGITKTVTLFKYLNSKRNKVRG